MKGRAISVTCLLCLVGATVLPAAAQAPQADDPVPVFVDMPDAPADRQAAENLEMAEDLEIMGAVLRAALTELYAVPASRGSSEDYQTGVSQRGPNAETPHVYDDAISRTGNPYSALASTLSIRTKGSAAVTSATGEVTRPQGAYLEGYGVVFHVMLDVPPPDVQHPKDTAENGAGGQLGPVQIEMLEGTDVLVLRGHKADVDRVIKAIDAGKWQNTARRLSGEPPAKPSGEAGVVVRTPTRDDLVEKLLGVLAENAGNFRHLAPDDRFTVSITFPRGKPPAISPRNPSAAIHRGLEHLAAEDYASAKRSSHEVSGDLHMRQQNYRKAIDVYRKALDQQQGSPAGKRTDLMLKLLQASVAVGELDAADQLLKQARAALSRSPKSASGSTRVRGIPLPARLTVSVAKSGLDEVAAGTRKREDLGKVATINYFNPPPETPGIDPARPSGSSGWQKTGKGLY